jgi:hypothetical protein
MDAQKFGKDFVRELKSLLPDREIPRYDEAWLKHWATFLVPHGWQILQKDDSFFGVPRECIPGLNFSEFWTKLHDDDKQKIWRLLQMAILHSFLDGDPTTKMDKLVETFKTWWASYGPENSEVDKILEDDKTPGHLKALLDAVLETRIFSLLQEVIAEIDLESLGIDPERPETLLNSALRPDSPLVKSLMESVQNGINERIKSGRFKQEEITRDIERIRAMVQSTFGKFINEQMFGAAVPGQPRVDPRTFMGNSPEARRQRMIARLQKKHRDKMSEGSNKK